MEEAATYDEDSCDGDGRVHENCGGSTSSGGGMRQLKEGPLPGGRGRVGRVEAVQPVGAFPSHGVELGEGRGRSLALWHLQLLTCFPQEDSWPMFLRRKPFHKGSHAPVLLHSVKKAP